MNTSNIGVKIIAGTLTSGALGGGIYGIYSYKNTTDTVKNYLIRSGLTIIEQSNSDFWEKVLKTYKLEKEGFEINNVDLSSSNGIKSWCNSTLAKKIKSKKSDEFKKASKWCTEYKTIKETLSGKQLESNAQKLNDKLEKFTKESKEEINSITNIDSGVGANTTGAKIIKWCENNANRSYSTNEERYFKDINANCLVDAPDSKGP